MGGGVALTHQVRVGDQLRGHIGQRAAQISARDKRLEFVLAEPKVGDLDMEVLPIPVDQQVVRLEVEVDNGGVLRMEKGHAPAGLDRHLAPLLERGSALGSPEGR